MTDRSYLFVPGNRPERFDKACRAGADIVLIDLEDAVAVVDKAAARLATREWLASGCTAYLRINGADSDFFQDDLSLLGLSGAQGVMLAKAEEPKQIAAIRRTAPTLPVIPLIESARGLIERERRLLRHRASYGWHSARSISSSISVSPATATNC